MLEAAHLLPPSGSPRWFNGFCATLDALNSMTAISAKAVKPPRRARWRCRLLQCRKRLMGCNRTSTLRERTSHVPLCSFTKWTVCHSGRGVSRMAEFRGADVNHSADWPGSGVSFNFGRILTAVPVSATGSLMTLFAGDYARLGWATSLFFAVGMLIVLFCPDTNGRSLDD